MAKTKSKTNKKTKETKDLYRYKLLIDSIERLECGRPILMDIHWCSNTITWLWKWRKITEEEMKSLCDRMCDIMEMQNFLRAKRREIKR